MENSIPITVVGKRILPGDRPVKAFYDVQIGDWMTFDWRLIKKDGQRAYVSVPQTSWRDAFGKIQYRALLSIPGELKQRIEVAILSAWEKELKKNEEQTRK